ncbi:MAG: hypothetical protein SGI92_28410 [Bryobacteraceae bacterium]|nr:hypothetical protein [Bryobacteraceae bacterium]
MRQIVPALLAWLIFVSPTLLAQTKPAPPVTEAERAIEVFRVQTASLGLRGEGSGAPKKAPASFLRSWHGRLYENLRNDVLDAVRHEIRQRGGTKNLLRRNQFGFNAGGPLVIPRLYDGSRTTFVSISYEGVRERISRTYLYTVPTLDERTGDYSATVDSAGASLPIYDPDSTTLNPNFHAGEAVSLTNLKYLRSPFPENRIPSTRLDPVAQSALALYPKPNTNVGPFFRNNYFVNSPETNVANGMISKVDHTLTERSRVSTELAFSNGLLGAAKLFPNVANPGPVDRTFASRRAVVDHVLTFSSHTVNTATFRVSSDTSRTGRDGEMFPVYSISPYLGMGRAYPNLKSARTTFVATDSLSTRRGKHALRGTAQFVRYRVNTFWPQYPAAHYRFGSGLTSLPGIVNTGQGFASFLLGQPEYAESSIVSSPSYFRRSAASISVREEYEVRKGLLISVGTNVEVTTPRTEKYDRQSTIDLRKGILIAAGRNGEPRGFQPITVRVEPRASLVWNPGGGSRTVVRAAFDRSFSSVPIYDGQWGTQGFNLYPTWISPNVQLEPVGTLRNGLPAVQRTAPDLRPESADNTIADLMDRSARVPTYQSASLTLQRELPFSTVATVGLTYAGGHNLAVSNSASNPNAIHPDNLTFRDLLNDEAFNRSLRPYPQYKGFDVYSSSPVGRYQRDAAFIRLEKRASMGLSFTAYYEFSKQMDDYSGPYGRQDYFNRENEWALTPGQVPHRLQVTYAYELPFGTNRAFLSSTDWTRYLANGWSVSGSAILYSGGPIYLRPQFNNTGGVLTAVNVDVVPNVDPHVADQGPALWFNPAAFVQPEDFSMGNGSRTHPSLRNPGSQNYDMSVSKRVALGPDRAVEFTAAGFNFINTANWEIPDNVIGTASAPNVNAGRILGSRGGRVIQLGLRLSF